MRLLAAVIVALPLMAVPTLAADREPASEIRPRVDHHLHEVARLIEHFETLVAADCPRFTSTTEWDVYVARETDQMLLLAAHAEQAWVEAKRTGDKSVRQAAKARGGRRIEEAIQVVDKLSGCAQENGTTFSPGPVYRRLERDLPQRQAEIALPP
jgi:hypothetical protein